MNERFDFFHIHIPHFNIPLMKPESESTLNHCKKNASLNFRQLIKWWIRDFSTNEKNLGIIFFCYNFFLYSCWLLMKIIIIIESLTFMYLTFMFTAFSTTILEPNLLIIQVSKKKNGKQNKEKKIIIKMNHNIFFCWWIGPLGSMFVDQWWWSWLIIMIILFRFQYLESQWIYSIHDDMEKFFFCSSYIIRLWQK